MSEPHALIAGAGIGGLSAALCLARRGFRVSLFERAKALQEQGAGLQISPNASAILRDLGVLPKLSGALAPQMLSIRRGRDGGLLQRLPLDDAERRWGAPYLFIHRTDLQKALVERVAETAAINLSLATDVSGFTADAKGIKVTARHDGAEILCEADCLIGADGLRSAVRPLLNATPRTQATAWPALPARARYLAWRTLVAADRVPAALRQPCSTLWLGPGAHIVHYPLREATVINLVAVIDAALGIDWTADLWSQPGDAALIQARFSDWHDDVRTLINAAHDWRMWPLVDLDPLPAWTSGRVALLGDAAHPMLPFLAQGAAQAIEDAAMLGAMLAPDQPIEPTLAAYGAARRPRANRVQRLSRRQGWIYHLSDPASHLRDMALRGLGPARFLAQYDWLYRKRPAINAPQ